MPRPTALRLAAAAGAGYVAGLLPSASLAAKAAGAGDIRTLGTGNPGAANAIGQLGKGWGYAVLAGDIGKAIVAARIGRGLAGDTGSHVAATAAVAGHCYPATDGFRGGKGVATSVGQCAATFPAYFVPDLALAAVTGALPWWKQRAHMATTISAVMWTGAATLWWRRGWSNLWGPEPTVALPVAAATTSAMMLQRFQAEKGAVRAFLDAAAERATDERAADERAGDHPADDHPADDHEGAP